MKKIGKALLYSFAIFGLSCAAIFLATSTGLILSPLTRASFCSPDGKHQVFITQEDSTKNQDISISLTGFHIFQDINYFLSSGLVYGAHWKSNEVIEIFVSQGTVIDRVANGQFSVQDSNGSFKICPVVVTPLKQRLP